ncbi:energy transducer TonB [Ekhidna sp.]|uniref:energy transducer TonB n=1 Tax=Ekhidna sp. TaxID=2608089 RepID=UPI003C7A7761
MKKILITTFFIISLISYSQESDSLKNEKFLKVDESAEFPGGIQEYYNYLAQNLRYPQNAQRLGIEGRVYIQFVVEKDGSISNVKVVKGIGAGCDQEAKRVTEKMPKWNPAKINGQPARQKIINNILFKFAEPSKTRKKKRKKKDN